ncbi:MBL fold metallo-hydrolase [Candidatus Woesearchaeota archaeon]|nr:MBL fold metallo-hydrolase [Nanoarchaeota archaeon]MCB9370938.1 MBL fold metallo-hydrolase [Candidatus Woesearchaeota archaeon]USN44040.1 MAG: MBL fold metallo-hydrolase [Candidatus Woesearchaeota archaeon]
MRTFALASGSSGNCFFVEGFGGKKILIDLGLSFQRTKEVLAEMEISLYDIDAVFLTHEHSDHIAGFEKALKELSCPFYLSKGTALALGFGDCSVGSMRFVKHHDVVCVGEDLRVFCVEKPHDAREALSFVVDSEGSKIGVFTDLGHVPDELLHLISTVDVLYFEANYCEDFIREHCASLSAVYLNRLMSKLGHLSLRQCCDALSHACHDAQKIVLSHISEQTNRYERAYREVVSSLSAVGKFPKIFVSFQGEASEVFCLERKEMCSVNGEESLELRDVGVKVED